MEIRKLSPTEFVQFIHARRFPLANEKDLQAAIERELTSAGVVFKREVRLSDADVVDFMLDGGTAVEVKIKGGKRAIYSQCQRYCHHQQVNALVLVTAVAMGFPEWIAEKPCFVASLGRGWL